MKKPFEIGTKVKVYATLNGSMAETPGEVVRIRHDGMLYVNLRGRRVEIVAHPKQCRRLIKKPHKEIWIHIRDIDQYLEPKPNSFGFCDWKKFREVKK